ncbi:COX15/CtaA family protein, partial [Acinetobacter baumannii]|uniref:COX15/CtaA family protein n=1 Tax=Acinetobacter baumannii TaxID=470 RepID=UPI002242D70F
MLTAQVRVLDVARLPQAQRLSWQCAPLRRLGWAVLALLALQIALGAWVSTNYAVLACTEVPKCQGQWWPEVD